jgi:hypothetical protein
MDEPLNAISASVRLAQHKDDLRKIIDALTENDVTILVIGHPSVGDETSYVSIHRHAHGYESIGLLRYAIEDELNDTVRKHFREG